MQTTASRARLLLLDVLAALAGRGTPVAEIEHSLRKDQRLEAAMEVLKGEGLVSVVASDRGPVYIATSAGVAAMSSHGIHSLPGNALVAVVFTDLVESTALIELLGEAEAHATRLRHFTLLRSVIANWGGREVKCLGDGLMVVFDRPGDALSAAREMQRAVISDADACRLRIGIDAGEPMRAAGDYFGTPVIVAKRLCDAAAAGEILITDRAYEVTGEEPWDGVIPRGPLTVKGFGEPVAAIAVAL